MQVSVGKEKETILDMLPYLRLGYLTNSSDMQSVISSQGPTCFVSLCYFFIFLLFYLREILCLYIKLYFCL